MRLGRGLSGIRDLRDLPTDAFIPLTALLFDDRPEPSLARAREAMKICLTKGEALFLAGSLLYLAWLFRKKDKGEKKE